MSWSGRLAEQGIKLPEVVAPLAAYVPAVRTGNLVYTAGQLPMAAGSLVQTGKVGADVTPEVGKTLARVCALNALAAVHSLVGIDSVDPRGQGRGVRRIRAGLQRTTRGHQRRIGVVR